MNYLPLKKDCLQDFGFGVINWTLFIYPEIMTVKVICFEKIKTSGVV